jgi:hypothetical protein
MAPPIFKLKATNIRPIGNIATLKSITYSCPWRKDNDAMMYEIIKFTQRFSDQLSRKPEKANYQISIMYHYFLKHEGQRYISSPYIPVGEEIEIPNAEYGQADITIIGRIADFTIMLKIPRVANMQRIV